MISDYCGIGRGREPALPIMVCASMPGSPVRRMDVGRCASRGAVSCERDRRARLDPQFDNPNQNGAGGSSPGNHAPGASERKGGRRRDRRIVERGERNIHAAPVARHHVRSGNKRVGGDAVRRLISHGNARIGWTRRLPRFQGGNGHGAGKEHESRDPREDAVREGGSR